MRISPFFYCLCIIFFAGCAQITETTKLIWGSSTKALEGARVDAITKTYQCSFDDCFDAVLALDREEKTYIVKSDAEAAKEEADGEVDEETDEKIEKVASSGVFDVFIQNRAKRHIVVMGIPGNVDTTEVGIFFSQPNLTTVKLEVSSLSSNAKRTVAQELFDELDLRFSPAP